MIDLGRVSGLGVQTLSESDGISVSGRMPGSRDKVLRTIRYVDGLSGMTVPVRVSWDSRADRWWKISSSSAQHVDVLTVLEWSVEAVPLNLSTSWLTLLTGDPLSNPHGVSGTRWWAPPVGARRVVSDASSTVTRTSADGDVDVGLEVSDNPRWHVDIGDWYRGSVRVEVDGEVVPTLADHTRRWRLSNGLAAVTLTSDSKVEVSTWDGGWMSDTFELAFDGTVPTWDDVRVLRSRPEQAVVRIPTEAGDVVDVRLTRGGRMVGLWVDSPGTSNITLTADTPATSVSAGLREDTSGTRWVVCTTQPFTSDTATGQLDVASATADFGVGHEVGGGNAQTGDSAAELVGQYVGEPASAVQPVVV